MKHFCSTKILKIFRPSLLLFSIWALQKSLLFLNKLRGGVFWDVFNSYPATMKNSSGVFWRIFFRNLNTPSFFYEKLTYLTAMMPEISKYCAQKYVVVHICYGRFSVVLLTKTNYGCPKNCHFICLSPTIFCYFSLVK